MISSGLISSSVKPQLTVDEVQRKRVACIISHVLQLTFSAVFDILICEEKVNRCDGCAIYHPSQRERSCLMMYNEDVWMYNHDEVRENRYEYCPQNERVSAELFKLSNSWEAYVIGVLTFPWTSMYLTSLEIEHCGKDLNSPIL